MSKISLKVNIGNRTYPLTAQGEEEEEIIRAAARYVNEQIKHLQENYAVKDMQDLLAMAALQVASKPVNAATGPVAVPATSNPSAINPGELAELNHLLDSALNKA